MILPVLPINSSNLCSLLSLLIADASDIPGRYENLDAAPGFALAAGLTANEVAAKQDWSEEELEERRLQQGSGTGSFHMLGGEIRTTSNKGKRGVETTSGNTMRQELYNVPPAVFDEVKKTKSYRGIQVDDSILKRVGESRANRNVSLESRGREPKTAANTARRELTGKKKSKAADAKVRVEILKVEQLRLKQIINDRKMASILLKTTSTSTSPTTAAKTPAPCTPPAAPQLPATFDPDIEKILCRHNDDIPDGKNIKEEVKKELPIEGWSFPLTKYAFEIKGKKNCTPQELADIKKERRSKNERNEREK